MESQKILNLLDSNDNESQKFATNGWYIINDQNTGNNADGNGEGGTTIKFETKVIKPNLCDYSDAYILVMGNIQNKPANSVVAFKNCAPFRTCDVTINDEHVEKAEDLDIVMPMYNLLEYYQDSIILIIIKIQQEVFISLKEMNHQMIMQMLLMIQQVWCINQNLLKELMIIMLIM